ncbi:MAG TPA: hypothetical protein VNX88_03055 [Terriglobales bacterium]|jgi:hypothetical protein|nr:hypothetical protein [Terriglobales bacterium]
MRKHLALCVLLAAPAAFGQGTTPTASTNENAAFEQRIRDLEDRIIALEGQVRMLKSQPASAVPAGGTSTPPATAAAAPSPIPETVAQAAPQEPVRLGGAGTAAAKALNPDISMIGDFIATTGHNPVVSAPVMEMHESELGVQAIIDPYARGDFFLSFGEEGVNLEEGYITFTSLPGSIVAKAGKMRSAFGKVNTLHNHVLPWIDRPIVSGNLVGGEDGIDDAGFSVTRILPAPKGLFLEGTGQLFRGDSADVFKSSQRSDVSVVGHLRGYGDISESTNLDLGVSYARGHNDLGSSFVTNLYGIDATLRYKPLRRAIYKSFVGRGEFIWSQRQQPGGAACLPGTCLDGVAPNFQRAFGFYTSGDYQFARRWFVGGRFDRSGRARDSRITDNGTSVVLTYWPSEFAQVRGQYRFTRYGAPISTLSPPGKEDANELLMQIQFSLGAHGAHPF